MACLCGSDEDYADDAAGSAGPEKRGRGGGVSCGPAGRREADWRAAGIDGFIYAGADLVAVLERCGWARS